MYKQTRLLVVNLVSTIVLFGLTGCPVTQEQGSSVPYAGSCSAEQAVPEKYSIPLATSAAPICNGHSTCAFLTQQYAAGLAAGNAGDYYQNIDGNHARFNVQKFPQVTELPTIDMNSFTDGTNHQYFAPVTYEESSRHTWYGTPQWPNLGSAIIMNGSFGFVPASGLISVPRYFYLRRAGFAVSNWIKGMERMAAWHENNVHIWHPAASDHDGNQNKFYSIFPGASLSQGISGSELDEVEDQFAILAAFRTDVKQWLRNRGLLMQTMLMAHHWGRAGSDTAYMQGAAFPAAMDNVDDAAALRMVQKANEITTATIPPFARVSVIGESFINDGSFTDENVFENAHGVARMFKQSVAEQHIDINAESSFDANCRPLSYHWRVLAGEFDTQGNRMVNIEQLEPGSWKKVRITVKPHQFVAPGTASTPSRLIYVGLYVNNGSFYSLPVLISVSSDPSLVPGNY